MSTISATTQPGVVAKRRVARLKAVSFAVAATLAVWGIATVGFDVNLRAPAFGNASENAKIGAGMVALTTAIGGLAAWAVLALTERLFPTRGRRTWVVIAVVALLVSFGGPFSGTGVSDENRLVLALMHLVAAAVLIPLLHRSSKDRQRDADAGTRTGTRSAWAAAGDGAAAQASALRRRVRARQRQLMADPPIDVARTS